MVENGINKLKDMVIYITGTKEKKIFDTIHELSNMYLFDKELAFSKRWEPEEFIAEITKSTKMISDTIREKFQQIENEIEEIGTLLIVLPKEAPNSRKKKKPDLKELIQMEPRLDSLKDFYAERLYNAINVSVLNSLKYLAEGCGYLLDYEDSLDYVDTGNELSAESLKYLRVKSTEDLTRPKQSDQRPLSVSAVLMRTSWNNEQDVEKSSFLSLEFTLKYTIPDVITHPSLDSCQKILKSVAHSMIESTTGV